MIRSHIYLASLHGHEADRRREWRYCCSLIARAAVLIVVRVPREQTVALEQRWQTRCRRSSTRRRKTSRRMPGTRRPACPRRPRAWPSPTAASSSWPSCQSSSAAIALSGTTRSSRLDHPQSARNACRPSWLATSGSKQLPLFRYSSRLQVSCGPRVARARVIFGESAEDAWRRASRARGFSPVDSFPRRSEPDVATACGLYFACARYFSRCHELMITDCLSLFVYHDRNTSRPAARNPRR